MQNPVSSENLEGQQEGYTLLLTCFSLQQAGCPPPQHWHRKEGVLSPAQPMVQQTGEQGGSLGMCPALQKLGDWLVSSSPSSQLDVSSGEKEGWCTTPSPQPKKKTLQAAPCLFSPCLGRCKVFPGLVDLAAGVNVSGNRCRPQGLLPAVGLKDREEAELDEFLGLTIFHFPKYPQSPRLGGRNPVLPLDAVLLPRKPASPRHY